MVGIAVLSALLIDIYFKTSFLIEAEAFARNKLVLTATFSKIIALPSLALSIIFYLRARLSGPIQHANLPLRLQKELATRYTRFRWLANSVVGITVGVMGLFLSHILIVRLIIHFKMQHSFMFILFVEVIHILVIAMCVSAPVVWGLTFEKVKRFYPEFHEELMRNSFIKTGN